MLNSLSGISLFDGLNSRQLELLLPLFENYTCPPNTMIFTQGEKAQYLYLIITGHALIQYKPYDGPPITISRLKPGDAFGWSAVVGNPIYSSGIMSSGPVQAIRIPGASLARLCREHPNTGSVILNRLASGVSGRWKDARVQVQTLLKDSLQNSSRQTGKG
jgi:CRP-like cAMP-binding protein